MVIERDCSLGDMFSDQPSDTPSQHGAARENLRNLDHLDKPAQSTPQIWLAIAAGEPSPWAAAGHVIRMSPQRVRTAGQGLTRLADMSR